MKNALYKSMAVVVLSLLAVHAAKAQTDTTKKDAQSIVAEAAKAIVEAPVATVAPPKPVYWKKSMQTSVQFSQTNLTNWAAGGVNNITLASYVDMQANYAKDKTSWSNRLQLDYGFIYQDDRPFIQKNTDRIYLESTFGHKATNKLNYSAQFSLRSQFTNTFTYITPTNVSGDKPAKSDWMDARTLKSGFFSPAYTTLAIGIDWLPNPGNRWLVANFAPLTGGFTVVNNKDLRTGYSMNRRKKYQDESKYPYTETLEDGSTRVHGEYYRFAKFQFGAQLKVDLNVKVNQNFTYSSQLVLFSDYLDKPQNLRVNFDNRIAWTIAKNLTLNLNSFLIYDDNVLIKSDDDIEKYPDGRRRIQFKEYIGIGFVYKFAGK